MQRRELVLRMSAGERLVGTSLDRYFMLGHGRHDRDLLPGWFVQNLVKDGLAEVQGQDGQIEVKLTEKTALWGTKRGIKPVFSESVTI